MNVGENVAKKYRRDVFASKLGVPMWMDRWDGYPAARKRVFDSIVSNKLANPVVIGGDVHSFNVNDLKLDFDDAASPVMPRGRRCR